ncbi:putative U3 small nucleolar RNA-associated protein 7 [Spiromyces aspiralis]|uniref:U3 small nucleolar RNA-associated protein 7 n=1 Tax=Spiromyces aspiralis TaxID=68401 RepID=A0ACC1HJD9_9FUNG|nr:putative U3 small nucleolar RNA-associated protein 7 [Spiromyces aspiralis]
MSKFDPTASLALREAELEGMTIDTSVGGHSENGRHSKGAQRIKNGNSSSNQPKLNRETKKRLPKYQRVQNWKAKITLKHAQNLNESAAVQAARAEMLLTKDAGYLEAEGLEKTFKFRQEAIADHLDINSAQKIFDLSLNKFGPYYIDYTRNGRNMLIGGRKGHIATFDWKNAKLKTEFYVRETVRDIKWLHNESMFAVAQKKYAYIYDHTGAEVHCLKKHVEPSALDFLPYHFLLVSTGSQGILRYQDVSTGQLVSEHRSGLGPCNVLRHNPYNAVEAMGHGNGVVTMWAPSSAQPLVKVLSHKGPVTALAFDRSGTYMATSGLDGQLKVWDVRTYKELHAYYTPTPAHSLDISQLGLLGVGYGPHATIWKDALRSKAQSPYMNHTNPSTTLASLKFVPYDDTLGIGHSGGISSIVVPGAGEPNFDALEANPFETSKQRREMEVHSLLDKIRPDMIMLDPKAIGAVESITREHQIKLNKERMEQLISRKEEEGIKLKNKKRGRNSAASKFLRKRQKNIIDLKKLAALEELDRKRIERERKRKGTDPETESGALAKFYADKRKRS